MKYQLIKIAQSISKSWLSNIGSSKNSATVISSPRMICITVLRLTPLFLSLIKVRIVLRDIAISFCKRYCEILRWFNIWLTLKATAVLNFIQSSVRLYLQLYFNKYNYKHRRVFTRKSFDFFIIYAKIGV